MLSFLRHDSPLLQNARVLAGALGIFISAVRSPIAIAEDPGKTLLLQKLPPIPDWITIQTEIAGTQRLMLVDTGFKAAALDNSLIDLAKPEGRMISLEDGEGRKVETPLYTLPQIRIQSLVADNSFVSLSDMSPFSGILGRKLDGILGIEQLKAGKILLNYDAGELEVHIGPWKLDAATSQQADLVEYVAVPEFEATIAGRHGFFIIDTGENGAISLEAALFTALVRNGSIELSPVQGRSTSLHGATAGSSGWFLRGELMGKDLTGVYVQSVGGVDGASILGVQWLCGFNIEIDRHMHQWRYQKRVHARPPLATGLMIGAVLLYPEKGALVERLRPDGAGPAQKAGLHVGDIIEVFDSLEGEHIDRIAVAETLAAKAGTTIPIRYLRKADGQRIETQLHLPAAISAWNFPGRDIFKTK